MRFQCIEKVMVGRFLMREQDSRSYPVRECLLCILSEEWEHRLYAERDLDALRARGA